MYITKSLRRLFVVNSLFVFASAFLGPLYAIYIEGIDKRPIVISVSWAIFILSATFFTYFVARYGDRIREKKFILAGGFLVRAVAYLGYIYIANVPSLFFIQILVGLGEALGSPAWNAIFADHLNHRKEILEYSEWTIISYVCIAAGTVMGGIIVTYLSFNFLFVLMSLFSLISFIGTITAPKRLL